MSEPPEDGNYASFWPEAPMPTVLDLLPATTQEAAEDPEGGRALHRRRRSSTRYNHDGVSDPV